MNSDEYLNNLIYIKKNSITDTLCDDIINLFESNKEHHNDGLTMGGVNKDVKHTRDMNIPKKHNEWKDIENYLYTELQRNLKIYKKRLEFENGKFIFNESLALDFFLIQKYLSNIGKYTYHDDHCVYTDEKERKITFLWYLNDVKEGGETEFFGNYKIKPEKGKLIFFPASWCFPHSGLMPKSNDKYIITGWFYQKITLVQH
jgi:hypothetical protein